MINWLRKNNHTRKWIYKFGRSRAKNITTKILPFLKEGSSILDIGAGTCNVAELLTENNLSITPLDIADKSVVGNMRPIIYDGAKLPFKDDSFDTALLITVLHHTKDPESILKEARRVARRIIVMEDIYTSRTQKYATWAMDSVLNLEFLGHPHTNKTDSEWNEVFQKLGLKKQNQQTHPFWKFFLSATYVLDREE